MKKTFYAVLIIVFCCIAACSEQKTERDRQLALIDSLSRQNQVDTAKLLLNTSEIQQQTQSEIAISNILSVRLYGTQTFADKLDSMLNYSENYFKSVNDNIHLAEVYLYKGDGCFLFKNEFDSSAYYIQQCKQLAEAQQDYYILSQVYWYQIFLHMRSGAIEDMKQDAEMQSFYAEKSKNNRQRAYAALNRVNALKYANETDKLNIYLDAAINWSAYLRKNDLAFIYNAYGELELHNNPDKAKDYFLKALELSPDSKLTSKNLAQLYLKQGDIKQAEQLCKECSEAAFWPEDKIDILTILADCKIASNDLPQAIELLKEIIAEKDSIIKRIQNSKQDYSHSETKIVQNKDTETNTTERIILLIIITALTLFLIRALISIHRLQQLVKYEKMKNHPGENLYNELMEDRPIGQWDKKTQEDFLAFYRENHPEKFELIETNYNRLSPREKIILILIERGKTQSEIQNILTMSESAYYTAISRIKKNKK
ncbi:MAG: tetratricopeptide repeat protein [Bacteroidales bacterium]|nr:tetratricopeptide repeat protein [Bacteroidales bacterium]